MSYQIIFVSKEENSKESVEKEIQQVGGKIISSEFLGQKKLAYPIQKETMGFYYKILFDSSSQETERLKNTLKTNENILKFLVISIQPSQKTPALPSIVTAYPPKEKRLVSLEETTLIKAPKIKEKKVEESEEKTKKERLKKLEEKLEDILKSV